MEAKYDFTKENLLTDQVVSIKVNKHLSDLTDTIKDLILGLRKVQAQEMIDTDILTRYQFSNGSIGIRASGTYVYTRNLGSSFILSHASLGRLGSHTIPLNYLGDSRSALTIQWSGGFP